MSEQLDLFTPPTLRSDPKNCRYIVYVDESGDHSLESIDKDYPVFVLAFCIFDKEHYCSSVVPSVERFKFKYFGHDHVVLHEHEIRKEKAPFNIFASKEAHKEFIDDLTDIITTSNFILIACVIDKNAVKIKSSTGNPYHIALSHCLEGLYDFLSEKGEQHKETHIITEMRGDKEDKEMELEFRRICDDKNYPFKVHVAAKAVNSSGLQLADLIARPIGRNYIKPDQENRAFNVLKDKFFCSGGRSHVGSAYEGWGLKVFPKTQGDP